MIVCLSTSSPFASIATFDDGGQLMSSHSREVPRAALGACLEWLEEMTKGRPVTGYVADIGPGSFTGVRVAVMLAKILAFTRGVACAGIPAWDLLPAGNRAIPSKAGEWFVRQNGEVVRRALAEPELANTTGYGKGFQSPVYPDAARLDVAQIVWQEPHKLIPAYLIEPSISKPKERAR